MYFANFSDSKSKQLDGLRKADTNSHAVYGDWVTPLLRRIDQTNFRGAKPKGPLGKFVEINT